MPVPSSVRNLVLVLGDQLDPQSAAFDGFDKARDCVWMAEVPEESEHVPSHKARIVLFLSAMRHFCQGLRRRGIRVEYRRLDDPSNRGGFGPELVAAADRLRPRRMIVVEPGEWRVRESLVAAAAGARVALEIRPDRHFLCSTDDFGAHAEGRRQLRMEPFYREMRRRSGVLMEAGRPVGGRWNYDRENRQGFGRSGPPPISPPLGFPPDHTTAEVMQLVRNRFPRHPGSLEHFDWPVTKGEARRALDDFIANRLANFGRFQDAMWTDHPYLFHSRLSAAVNLKLLDPRDAITSAVASWRSGRAPLSSVEGFIRQLLGWREYVRGIYWRFMPSYASLNMLDAQLPLPECYWTADTDVNCLLHVIRQTLDLGFAHHIQRLMVTGLFALLLGVQPSQVHRWYLAVYVDAVEWVEMPNTLGMSQYADGGLMASKPYVASGKYIQKMSNYCNGCRYQPGEALGDRACPFTTLYWDFLARHEQSLRANPRMALQLRNLSRLSHQDRTDIANRAQALRKMFTG